MYINEHGHQIFAKCTLNECTKMELDPPPPITASGGGGGCIRVTITASGGGVGVAE